MPDISIPDALAECALRGDLDALTCPWYQGIDGAQCVSGCWEQPDCQDYGPPAPSWTGRDAKGRSVTYSQERLAQIAQARWNEHKRLGDVPEGTVVKTEGEDDE